MTLIKKFKNRQSASDADEGVKDAHAYFRNNKKSLISSYFSPTLVEMLFLLTCASFTVFAFLFLTNTVEDIIEAERNNAAKITIQDLNERFSDVRNAIDQTAYSFNLIETDINKGERLSYISQNKIYTMFDEVSWLFKNEANRWQYQSVYRSDLEKNEEAYRIKPESKIPILLKSATLFERSEILSHMDFELEAKGNFAKSFASQKPIIFSRTIDIDKPEKGVLFFLLNPKSLVTERWLWAHENIERLTLRNAQSDDVFFHYDRRNNPKKTTNPYHIYELNFGDSLWEVTLEISQSNYAVFLEAVPFYIVIFGFLITSLGGLYLRGGVRYSLKLKSMNSELEQKNSALENEVLERTRLFSELQTLENDNRAIIDAVSDIIFETNKKGEFLFISASWQRVTGFNIEQSKGLEIFNVVYPEDTERLKKEFKLMMAAQRDAVRMFTKLRTSSGNFRAIEIFLSVMHHSEQGASRIVGTITDVEERRRAERALSEAEKKYRAIVENAAGGIFQVTPEGLYLSVNPAMSRILGYENPEDVLRSVKNANKNVYVNANHRRKTIKTLNEKGVVNNFEAQVYCKNGDVIWINENSRAVLDNSNNILYYEGSMEDITERKTVDLKLREAKIQSDLANRAKSEFLANMSHELRTPLNAIIGFSDIIKSETFGKVQPDSYLEYAKDIHTSGQNLLQIINEILDISKIEAGERYLNEGVLNTDDTLQSCLNILSSRADAGHVKIINSLDGVPNIIAEELAIKQVFMNLLSNAIKFTPEGGRISITYDLDHNTNLRISITDTGIGLDDQEVRKALSPFGQVQTTLNRSNTGTGLGLTLVHSLLKLHGGRLELFSQKGIGTTATMILPKSRLVRENNEKANTDLKDTKDLAENKNNQKTISVSQD